MVAYFIHLFILVFKAVEFGHFCYENLEELKLEALDVDLYRADEQQVLKECLHLEKSDENEVVQPVIYLIL